MKTIVCLCVAVCAALCLTACGTTETPSDPLSTQPTNAPAALIPVDIRTLLTQEQVEHALGVAVGEPQTYDQNTVIAYRSEDWRTGAELALQTGTRDTYAVTAALYDGTIDAPNLGEVACWSRQAHTLLVYGKGYLLEMTVTLPRGTDDDALLAARELAAWAMEALPAAG